MKALGIDIGTTTISMVVLENDVNIFSRTYPNDSFIVTANTYERIQDANKIWDNVNKALSEVLKEHSDISAIGMTGQQHGIVYLDEEGNAISPLYTWQDKRGDLVYKGSRTYAEYLSEYTDTAAFAGYGNVTHFFNQVNGLVPKEAKVYCTIADYVAAKITGRSTPTLDASMSASLGLFSVKDNDYEIELMERAGFDVSRLPKKSVKSLIGYHKGIPVFNAIGDNQASFIGATGGQNDSVLLNVGTGSQISIHVSEHITIDALETRPYPLGGYLLVGATLCGGRAYAILNNFFKDAAKMLGHPIEEAYSFMNRCLEDENISKKPPVIDPRFQGTRLDTSISGAITSLTEDNFHPVDIIYGMLKGISQELYDMYYPFKKSELYKPVSFMSGSGNGLRKNEYLKRIMEELFETPIKLSKYEEEAASGAAIYATKMIV